MNFPTEKAFTLIELLTVIALIAVLVALASVTVRNVMRTAEAVKCASNMKTVWQGALLYASDNNGKFPGGIAGAVGPAKVDGKDVVRDSKKTALALQPYGITDESFDCPDPLSQRFMRQSNSFGYVWQKAYYPPYSPFAVSPTNGAKSLLNYPETPLSKLWVMGCFNLKPVSGYGAFPHNKRNMLYADGHVERNASD